MSRPVDKSMTVSAPHNVDHRSFSTSSSIDDETAEFPLLALILTAKLRPIIIGSSSGWLTLAGNDLPPPPTPERADIGSKPPPSPTNHNSSAMTPPPRKQSSR